MDIFLTELQIFEITGFNRSQLFKMIEEGEFSKLISIDRIDKWLESEVIYWINSRDLHISR